MFAAVLEFKSVDVNEKQMLQGMMLTVNMYILEVDDWGSRENLGK